MLRRPVSTIKAKGLHAFTLLELIAVFAVLSILAALAYPDISNYLAKAREVVCMSNMKSITLATRSYLIDHDSIWPQPQAPYNSPEWENFWTNSLEPYGVGSKVWQCPQILAQTRLTGSSPDDAPKIHYTPTAFPPIKGIAYRWEKQPWFIERASAHGSGALIAFPDGSVKQLFRVLAESGAR